MKRLFMMFVAGMMLFPTTMFAQKELNAEQKQLQNSLYTFLKEEGYMPEYDSDGDIKFKSEGKTYYFSVSDIDTNPMYVSLNRYFNYPENYSPETLLMATKQLNRYKGVKVSCYDKTYTIGAELYVRNVDLVKECFYKIMAQIDNVKDEVLNECEKVGASTENMSYVNNGENLLLPTTKWKKRDENASLSFKNGKMYIKDLADNGWSGAYYQLPQNLKNKDFQIEYTIKITFAKRYSGVYFAIGESLSTCHTFSAYDDGDGILNVAAGTYGESRKYCSYTDITNSTSSGNNTFKIVKRGKNISWSCNGTTVFSCPFDSNINMNIVGFYCSSKHKIEVSKLNLIYL